jgi:N-acetylmuramoyl-L-alanine amidase
MKNRLSKRWTGTRAAGLNVLTSLRLKRFRFAAALLLSFPLTARAAPSEPVVFLTEGQRRELSVLTRGDVEMLSLETLLTGLGVASRMNAAAGSVTLAYQGREAILYNKKSLASIGGDLRLLSAPVLLEQGQWYVPVDAVPRLLGPLLGLKSEWRPASRVLTLGSVGAPRLSVNTYVSGDSVRVVISATEKVPFRVEQEQGKVTVRVPRDVVDTSFTQERLTGGIVDWVQYVGGRDNVFAITPGRRFQDLQVQEQDGPPRLVLEFRAAAAAARKEGTAPTPAPAPTPRGEPAPAAAVRTVVIDPGHGGDEVGAVGPGGAMEKDVTLAVARRLRAAIQNSLGYQAFLTRDTDAVIALDDRAAVANNYKADLFVSIHCNASRAHGAHGSEVYFLSYQASDDESRRIAQEEGAAVLPLAPAGSDLSLILWDMAQAEHLEESSALASRIQEELADVTGSRGRGIKQAPFRVLVGAAMPAVLVEIAFISNAEEEKLLVSDAWQAKIVAALLRGISRFEAERTRAASLAGGRSTGTP